MKLTITRPLRAAGRLLALGVLAFTMTGLLAPAPAWANFSGCNYSGYAPCETVNGSHRFIYWVEPGEVSNVIWGTWGHVSIWYQVPNGPQVTIWSSNPSGAPWYDQWYAGGSGDNGTFYNYPKHYLNTAYPQ